MIALYSYIIYPVFLYFASKLRTKHILKFDQQFGMSLIISVFNEEKIIEQRISNLGHLRNNDLKFEVIIGSDNSSDRTNEILSNYDYEWLKVVNFSSRRGKAAVLNDLVSLAKNPILIFTDANTIFEENAITELLKPFDDPSVGGVCGRLILKEYQSKKSGSVDEKNYWQIETYLKKWEGDCGMVIGANGGIYAIRREVYKNLPTDKPVTDDFLTTMNVLNAGYKFVYCPTAIAYEEVAPEIKDEFRRKIRFSSTNFQTIKYIKSMLYKNGLVSFGLWSHKILRWFMPIVFIILFITNLILLNHNTFYQLTFFTQIFFYLLGLMGFVISQTPIRIPYITLPYFFILTNFALLIGFFKFLFKKHRATWESTPR